MILRPKEDYDGAMPSGNSLMAWNLVRLSQITGDEEYRCKAEEQLNYLREKAQQYPIGYGMFRLALLNHELPALKVTVVLGEQENVRMLPVVLPSDAAVTILREETKEYPLKEGKTTFYVCRDHSCLPPVNDLNDIIVQKIDI